MRTRFHHYAGEALPAGKCVQSSRLMQPVRTLPMPLERPWQLALVVLFALASFRVGFRFDQPMLIAASSLVPIAVLFAWSRPFVICALFIAFSYFRLPEAYPFLVGLKPALVLGMVAVTLVAVKALLSPTRGNVDARPLRVLSLLSLIGTIGVAVPLSLGRSGGVSSLDTLLIPAVMIGAALTVIVWTMLLSATANNPLPVNVRLFAAFFAFVSLDTIVSVIPSHSFDVWSNMTWKIAAMALATSWLARSERDLVTARNIFVVSGALIAAVVIYNKIHDISLVQGTRVSIGRVISDLPESQVSPGAVLSDPNDLALILLFPLAFTISSIFYRRSLLEASIAALISAVIVAAIIFTQSRGAAIGLMAVLAIMALRRFKARTPALIAFVVATPLLVGAMNLSERASGGFVEASEGDLDESAQHRLDAWKTAINMAVARPLTGVGLGNFPQLYYAYTDFWFNREIAVHSMWFQVLSELGFVGFGLFVAMIWTSFKVNARSLEWLGGAHAPISLRAAGMGLEAALAGTCASGTFLSQAHTWPVYLIVAMIAALSLQAQCFSPGSNRGNGSG